MQKENLLKNRMEKKRINLSVFSMLHGGSAFSERG
jgi:hypothetical protein